MFCNEIDKGLFFKKGTKVRFPAMKQKLRNMLPVSKPPCTFPELKDKWKQ
jgi:hypothetical protein